ncbi:ABC transporter permease [Dactylosporangium sp. NPDC005572]|uniref:ABC transporter permease n=1 Tax=Dactylosporangium sp. NPDC005572 TaxID=3156889 RepID=UPI0033A84F9B
MTTHAAGVAPPDARLAPRPRLRAVLTAPWLLRTASLAAFLVAWQLIGKSHPLAISYPTAIVEAARESFRPEILPAFGETLKGLAVGFGLSIVLGIPIGLLMGRSRIVELALSPYVNALYATPRLALVPLLVLWLGISFEMRVGIVFISAALPIIVNTYLGTKEVNPDLVDTGKAFVASELQIYRGVVLRGSLPFVFAGLRIGLGKGMIGTVIAEIMTSAGGVGNLIVDYARYFRIADMFVVIVLLGLVALAISWVMRAVELSLTEPWNRRPWKVNPLRRTKAARS